MTKLLTPRGYPYMSSNPNELIHSFQFCCSWFKTQLKFAQKNQFMTIIYELRFFYPTYGGPLNLSKFADKSTISMKYLVRPGRWTLQLVDLPIRKDCRVKISF